MKSNQRDSDAICSALQLINFWQDVAIDWQKQRIYIPQEDLQRFGVTEAMIAAQDAGPAFQALMQCEVQRARALMVSGAPLAKRLPGRIGWELRFMIQGGLRICARLDRANTMSSASGRNWASGTGSPSALQRCACKIADSAPATLPFPAT